MNVRSTIAAAVTFAWCAGFALLLYWKQSMIDSLTLNEWGDFFSGAMAPLALFWLVMGYLQQGEELRLNTEALRAQQEELRRQVAETAVLAENSKRQAAAAEQLALASMDEVNRAKLKEAAEAMPIFRPTGGQGSGDKYRLHVRNAGATVSALTIECPDGIEMHLEPTTVFETGAEGRIAIRGPQTFPYEFSITYRDSFGKTGKKRFSMTQQFQFIEIHDF